MKSKLIPLVGVLAIAAAVGLGAFTMARGQGWHASESVGGFHTWRVASRRGPGPGQSEARAREERGRPGRTRAGHDPARARVKVRAG